MYEAMYYASTFVSTLTFVVIYTGVFFFRGVSLLRPLYLIMLIGYSIIYPCDLIAIYNEWIPWMKVQSHPPPGVIYNQARQLCARITIVSALASPFVVYWQSYGRE